MIALNPFRPQRVGIVGGGTAGYLTALALKEWRPELDVTIIVSPDIPVIGVGEATTPPLVAFLHGYLGIDPQALYQAVRPTWKLGIRLEWGRPDQTHFNYAFGPGDVADAQLHDQHVRRYCLNSLLMDGDSVAMTRLAGQLHSLIHECRFAYHLDNAPFVAFLETHAANRGVTRKDATIAHVEVGAKGVEHLVTDAGETLAYDLYLDCTGFGSLLMGETLGSDFIDYKSSLACDSALVSSLPHEGFIKPYTTATTMEAGWCWNVPQRHEDHVGYVFSSAFMDQDAAAAELAALYPGAAPPRLLHFRSGRREHFVRHNVVAIGNSYGFVEPLEATALHMVVIQNLRLLRLLTRGSSDVARANRDMGAHWDYLRWFLAIHYRFNQRSDSAFWRHCRAETDIGDLAAAVGDFERGGPFSARPKPPRFAADSVFGVRGLDVLLLGQGVPTAGLRQTVSRDEWTQLCQLRQTVSDNALPQTEALALAERDRSHLDRMLAPGGWAGEMAALFSRLAEPRGRSPMAIAAWARSSGVSLAWPKDYAQGPMTFPHTPCRDFGKFITRVPDFVLRPTDQDQLAACLTMLSARRIPFKVRGAGHSSGGQALIDDGAVVELRWLRRTVADDPQAQTFTVEAGAWWLEVCSRLAAQGRRVPVLTDNWRSTVGGTLAVGGFGDSSHLKGLQIDTVKALTVMTLDGQRHHVGPGDPLFDYSLAGRGQLGVVTEVTFETIARPSRMRMVLLSWESLEDFLADSRTISADGRFEYLRARLDFSPGAPVRAVAGNFDEDKRAPIPLDGLRAKAGKRGYADFFDKHAEEPPAERWALASPSVELIFDPSDEGQMRVLSDIHRRVADGGLSRWLPEGASVMAVKRTGHLPLAPLPDADFGLMLALRPEVPHEAVEGLLDTLAAFGEDTLAAGGKVYLMSIPIASEGWLERQFGAQLERFRQLKRERDPHNLLNPGLLYP